MELSESVRKSHILFAVPCYGGQVTEAFFTSFLKLTLSFQQLGLQFSLQTIVNDSLVTRARNTCVAHFFGNPDATHLMFIDADIRFEASDVLRLLGHDLDVVGAAYPKKALDWKGIKASAAETPAELLKYAGSEYTVNASKNSAQEVQDVKDLGTGFLLMKRKVLTQMREKYPQLKYRNTMIQDARFNDHFYALFDSMIDEDQVFLSEDYGFCRRWQKLGGKIYWDRKICLDHVGTYVFNGRPMM